MKKIFSILLCLMLLVSLYGCKDERVHTLSNPSSTENARALYSYIASLGEDACLSGQQESTWMGSDDYELDYLLSVTGKQPAIRGFDYMNDDFDGVNARAESWWKKGGIVTICWHTGSDFFGEWKDSQEDEIADWEKALTEGTKEYQELLDGMDKGAEALLKLKEKGITVLWRPFHEFDGGWFWWGKGGAESFRRLWIMMYERYTDYWQLDNLIWVLGYSHMGEDYKKWYPGDEYCDIIGADSYEIELQASLCRKVGRVADKPLCFHECGDNPTAAELEKSRWCWFMTWHTEYLTERNTVAELSELYNSEYVITLDELPDLNG